MIPMGSTVPHDSASFRAGLAQGLALLGKDASAILLEGDFPKFDKLALNLTGAKLSRALRLPALAERGDALCFARTVAAQAKPATFEGVPFALDLAAEDVVLAAARGPAGEVILRLDRASRGTLDFSITRADLEAALLVAAREGAEKKGVEVKSVQLEITSQGPRSLALRAVVTAKAMFFTTTVTVAGRVEINAALEARLSGLECVGEGMAGKLAAGMVRPKFAALEGRSFALGQIVAGLALREVTLHGGDALRVQATFGEA